jgi:hypothetical protein
MIRFHPETGSISTIKEMYIAIDDHIGCDC